MGDTIILDVGDVSSLVSRPKIAAYHEVENSGSLLDTSTFVQKNPGAVLTLASFLAEWGVPKTLPITDLLTNTPYELAFSPHGCRFSP